MGLLDDIREAAAPAVRRCRIAEIREDLGKEADDLDAAIGDPAVRPGAIIAVLRKRGITLGDHALRKHRAGTCPCFK